MVNGLWTIEFISVTSRYGAGVLVLRDGTLLGGDAGYYYSGKYQERGDKINGIATITRFEPNSMSVFGNYDELALCFNAKLEGNCLRGEAYLRDDINKRMQIKCTKKEDV